MPVKMPPVKQGLLPWNLPRLCLVSRCTRPADFTLSNVSKLRYPTASQYQSYEWAKASSRFKARKGQVALRSHDPDKIDLPLPDSIIRFVEFPIRAFRRHRREEKYVQELNPDKT